jgi:hypothetical protein
VVFSSDLALRCAIQRFSGSAVQRFSGSAVQLRRLEQGAHGARLEHCDSFRLFALAILQNKTGQHFEADSDTPFMINFQKVSSGL